MRVKLDSQLVHCSQYYVYNLCVVGEEMRALYVFPVCSHTYSYSRARICRCVLPSEFNLLLLIIAVHCIISPILAFIQVLKP